MLVASFFVEKTEFLFHFFVEIRQKTLRCFFFFLNFSIKNQDFSKIKSPRDIYQIELLYKHKNCVFNYMNLSEIHDTMPKKNHQIKNQKSF